LLDTLAASDAGKAMLRDGIQECLHEGGLTDASLPGNENHPTAPPCHWRIPAPELRQFIIAADHYCPGTLRRWGGANGRDIRRGLQLCDEAIAPAVHSLDEVRHPRFIAQCFP